MMAFEYYEVRPVIEENGTCHPYDDEQEFFEAVHALNSNAGGCNALYTIYGRYTVDGASEVQAIGDFQSKEDALAILNAMLAGPARARDLLGAGSLTKTNEQMAASIVVASAMLDDLINQSSSAERL